MAVLAIYVIHNIAQKTEESIAEICGFEPFDIEEFDIDLYYTGLIS